MSTESVMPSNHLILCLTLLLLPPIFPSIRVFSNELTIHIRWQKYWSFGFSISPSSEYPWLVSFRTDWFAHLAIQGTLRSLFQHHSSKASILSAVCKQNPFVFLAIYLSSHSAKQKARDEPRISLVPLTGRILLLEDPTRTAIWGPGQRPLWCLHSITGLGFNYPRTFTMHFFLPIT